MDDKSKTDGLTLGLRTLNAIAKKLKAKRTAAGALTLASPEVCVTHGTYVTHVICVTYITFAHIAHTPHTPHTPHVAHPLHLTLASPEVCERACNWHPHL